MINIGRYILGINLLIVIGCGQEENYYDSRGVMNEIEDLITRIIRIDSIENHYPDYLICSVLPKYVSRENKDEFIPGPPPNSDYLFPDLIFEFEDKGIEVTARDIEFFREQMVDSKRLILSKEKFGDREAEITVRTEKRYIYFSIPIFNLEKDIAWIRTGMYCGRLCG